MVLAIWILNILSANKTITKEIITVKAFDFTTLINIESVTGSASWLNTFKKRYNIK